MGLNHFVVATEAGLNASTLDAQIGRPQVEDAQECRCSRSVPYMAEEILAQLRAAKLCPEQEDCAENIKEADYARCQSAAPQHKEDFRYAIFMVVAHDVRFPTALPTLTEKGGARNICTLQCLQRSWQRSTNRVECWRLLGNLHNQF